MKDYKDIQDLLNSTRRNKYAFVDYLLEYLDGDYHCLDFTVRNVLLENKDWSLKYKHLFSLLILKAIENSGIDIKDDVRGYMDSFVRDYNNELRKEKCQFEIDSDIDVSVLSDIFAELLEDDKNLNSTKQPTEPKRSNSTRQGHIKKCEGKVKESPKSVLGTSCWGRLTVNSSVGEIIKLVDANEAIPITAKYSCFTHTEDTLNENIFVRIDLYKGKKINKLDIFSSIEKTLLVEFHAADILLSPFKQTCVRVTAGVTISIDNDRNIKEDIVWSSERFRYTRDWVDSITPSNDEPFDYQNGLGGLVGG